MRWGCYENTMKQDSTGRAEQDKREGREREGWTAQFSKIIFASKD